MDALSALRDLCVAKQIDAIEERNGTFDLGGRNVFPGSYLTPFKSQEGKGDFYSVQVLVFFAKKIGPGFKFGEYVRAAKEAGVETIKLIDRKHLESYLTGARDTSEYIVPEQLPFQASGDHLGGDVERVQVGGKSIDESTEDTALQTILSNELQLRNRNSMLTVPGRSFDKVMDILEHVAREELQNVSKMNGGRQDDSRQVVGPRSSGRFQRQTTTDAAVKQLGAQSLGIQSVGFGGMQSNPMVEIQTGEKKREREDKAPVRPLVVPRPVKKPTMPTRPKATPLILVPPAVSAILNMYNIKEFLENGNFMTSEEAMKRNPKKPAYERCMRSEGRKSPVKYHVTDRDPSKKEDWDRVVAVFCLGKAWQFKKWPFEGAKSGDMVETFLKVAGIHVHFADEPIDPLIKKWNVKLISISRHSRSQDQAAMRAFWAHLDAFLGARNNSHVAY